MVNGIKLSLRRYVLAALLIMGTVLISALSWLAANNFFEGMDGMQRGTMVSAGLQTQVKSGEPKQVLNYIIAADWQDLPHSITSTFDADQMQPFRLHKKVDRDFIFFRPRGALFVVKLRTEQGEEKFVAQVFRPPRIKQDRLFAISHEGVSLLVGLGALVLFSCMLLILMRSVARPVERLKNWAAELDEKTLDLPIPPFRYKELDELARLTHGSLQNVRQVLHREKEFVSHASHELRTPIAVIRSSVDLLHRLPDVSGDKGQRVIQRISHASHTMTDLTETLLWLGRPQTDALHYQATQPGQLITQLCHELNYLLNSKQVKVQLETDSYHAQLPVTALRIVLGNIIRNAFQHTQSGTVTVHQQQLSIVVENSSAQNDESAPQETGYGLGLELVDRLTARLGWDYTVARLTQGYRVTLHLTPVA